MGMSSVPAWSHPRSSSIPRPGGSVTISRTGVGNPSRPSIQGHDLARSPSHMEVARGSGRGGEHSLDIHSRRGCHLSSSGVVVHFELACPHAGIEDKLTRPHVSILNGVATWARLRVPGCFSRADEAQWAAGDRLPAEREETH